MRRGHTGHGRRSGCGTRPCPRHRAGRPWLAGMPEGQARIQLLGEAGRGFPRSRPGGPHRCHTIAGIGHAGLRWSAVRRPWSTRGREEKASWCRLDVCESKERTAFYRLLIVGGAEVKRMRNVSALASKGMGNGPGFFSDMDRLHGEANHSARPDVPDGHAPDRSSCVEGHVGGGLPVCRGCC